MRKFTVSKPYTMPREDLRAAIEELAEQLEHKHGIRSNWRGDSVRIKSAGTEGLLDFAGDTIDITVKLGLLAVAFESKLKKGIQQYLDLHVS